MNEKIESTKYHQFFRKKVRDNLKEISSVSSIQKWLSRGGQKQMHSSAIYKGYSCIKSMVKMQQNSKWCRPATSVLLKIPFITIQRYATYFFFIVLFLQVCFDVCTFLVPVLGTLCCLCCFHFCHYHSILRVLRVSSAPFLHFSCIGMKMKKAKSQVITKTESRTRDWNGTCVFGSINVLYRNRCWKTVKKTYFCYIVGKLNWQTMSLEK